MFNFAVISDTYIGTIIFIINFGSGDLMTSLMVMYMYYRNVYNLRNHVSACVVFITIIIICTLFCHTSGIPLAEPK